MFNEIRDDIKTKRKKVRVCSSSFKFSPFLFILPNFNMQISSRSEILESATKKYSHGVLPSRIFSAAPIDCEHTDWRFCWWAHLLHILQKKFCIKEANWETRCIPLCKLDKIRPCCSEMLNCKPFQISHTYIGSAYAIEHWLNTFIERGEFFPIILSYSTK